MHYDARFFKEDKDLSYQTPYNYVLTGAFYEVFVGNDGSYHMALEEKESLLARFSFYKRIKHLKFPIYVDKKQQNITEDEKFMQIIGLPTSVVTKTDETGNIQLLTEEEILSSINFEEGLFHYDKEKKIQQDIDPRELYDYEFSLG